MSIINFNGVNHHIKNPECHISGSDCYIKILNESIHFWQSQLYHKSYFKRTDKRFSYFDSSNIFRFLFFGWVRRWTKYISKEYVEPYKLHPLPVSDQILYWQPIFSKHVSDGLVRLENYETNKLNSSKVYDDFTPYKSILLRALWLTFWKRTLFGLLGIITTNILSMSIAILVKKLLKIFNDKSITFIKTFFLLLVLIILHISDGLLIDNFTFYMYRLIHLIQYSFSITIFQHGLCHRRKYFNNVEGSNALNVCNNVLHSFSPDSECSKNPLYCPARRYQNKDITPRIFSFEFIDSYYISLFVESSFNIINFLSNFIYGVLLMSLQIKVNLCLLYVVGLFFVFFMIFVEVVNTYILNFIYRIKDYRISKSIEIISGLPLIYKTLYDDIAINIITQCRNNELSLIVIRIFFTFLNRSLHIICINISFYVIMRYFVKTINNVEVITEIDTAGFMTTLYIFLKIIDSMNMLPHAIKRVTTSYTSFNRVKKHTNECSPNYYISDNKFTGSVHMGSGVNCFTTDIDKDVLVSYRNASFSWLSSPHDSIYYTYNDPNLMNINFELKRGEVAIITGSQGSGKSNFIKSVLGEMTLVGGSMAVIPLHTSMPIFYASQDIWLFHGTIRSNITFGYKYDESLYNVVLKAVELDSDISSWEDYDMRVVSNYGYCLSGGQRVRMELARAIYAYMIFSQVNKQYNDGKCSFLMCLDSSFNGLDPFVSKTIFNNLFNSKSGLLIKDDLSVILSSSKRSLDICVGSSDLKKFPDIPVYNIKNESFSFCCSLSDFIGIYNNLFISNLSRLLPSSNLSYNIYYFTSDMFKLCSSGSHTRDGRKLVTKAKFDHRFNSFDQELDGVKFNPYIIYFKAAGLTFIVFIILTFSLTIMDNVKFVFATNLSDYITKNINDYNSGHLTDMDKIKTHSLSSLTVLFIFISLIIVLSLLSTLFLSISCIVSSRKIHEYCIESLFKNSSSVIKIKKYTCQVITYLSSDIFQIDEGLGYAISTSLMSLIETIIHLCTLFYLVPMSIPFISLSLFIIYKFVLLQYVTSSRNLQLGSLESIAHINTVCENAISGSSICRSFKKEWEFMNNLIEYTDYYMRCRFLNKAIITWSSILTNWIFSTTTLFVLFIPIIFDQFTKYKLKVGYFGLALSLSMNVIKTFTCFSLSVARLEIYMCSVNRFQSFIPPGTKCVFNKSINVHEEYLPIKYSHQNDYKFDKKWIYNRRMSEFKAANKKFISLKKIFFKPKINVVDVTNYVTPEHQGVQLKDVRVYTSLEKNVEGMILKGLTVSAHKSDIIGIIGRTGAGKTTLLSVLENTVRNRTGQVLLDGKDLNDIPKNVTRQIIGVLPQLPFVFKGWTVRRFLDPRKLFSDDEINQALDNCGLLEFVNNLQGGKKLDSIIIPEDIDLNDQNNNVSIKSNKGSKSFKSERSLTMDTLKIYYEECDMLLSSTQLRTLAFARLVLYRYFYRIILVDEPPSENCDYNDFSVSDSFDEVGIPIYKLIRKFFSNSTSFIAAHDASVLRLCTSVWVIHDGKLIRTCKSVDISANESISNIIEQSIKNDKR